MGPAALSAKRIISYYGTLELDAKQAYSLMRGGHSQIAI